MNNKNYHYYFENFRKLITFDKKILSNLVKIEKLIKTLSKNNKIMIFGNGGSDSIANHFASDISTNSKINCLNFNQTNLLTCLSNDYGFENWIAKSIEIFGKKGDLLICISSSGNSKNMLNAVKEARKKRFKKIITFTGFEEKNKLKKSGDVNIWVNSKKYNFVENSHQILLLSVADMVNIDRK